MYGMYLVLLLWGVALFAIRRDLSLSWTEPCLRHPVMVFEGDDWGYGPLEQIDALREIAAELGVHRDLTGRHPVMTLGVILAGPGAGATADEALGVGRVALDDVRLKPVRDAMTQGVGAGVFDLQLHGMEHYHPEVLARVAQVDPQIRAWIAGAPFVATEQLPSPLQSRWTDASALPSRALDEADIRARVAGEVAMFRQCFGTLPEVVVPPTFVWNESVERAWAAQGLAVLVTPGERYEMRGADGLPVDTGICLHNGQRCTSGLLAMVRNDYFEPLRGHRADHGLESLATKWAQRRPLLLETHRSNFVGAKAQRTESVRAIGDLVSAALRSQPELRFLTVAELARHYAQGGDLIDRRPWTRTMALLHRLDRPGRRRKIFGGLAVLTAASAVAALVTAT
ncbi:hypothetical protein BSY238_1054 [Methyloversatilis sp. RAC08]|uniref:hypothetical protein n=1 Tax=Methyloversatilis sp. RAC08 TaxID=1842540 RepID=UPI00083D0F8F|nr:hypothetical protein [Methyloversatilis sp. RAC08]AOF82854.1 hypothetical protein BSY238_1054 [Methyloversatilis sp. RAC08]